MQASQKSVIMAISLCSIALLLVGVFGIYSINQNIKMIEPEVPTAEEIAELIEINIEPNTTNNSIDIDNSKIDEIWGAVFGWCYNTLETKAENDVISEVESPNEWDNLIEFVEENLDDYDENSLVINNLDGNETEVEVTKLGYCNIGSTELGEEEDDKSAEVKLVYKFTYEDNTDNTEYKGEVEVIGEIVYDEGDWNDKDVELSYSL